MAANKSPFWDLILSEMYSFEKQVLQYQKGYVEIDLGKNLQSLEMSLSPLHQESRKAGPVPPMCRHHDM